MGTRNLIAVVVDGEYKVAQYCQWDGYPEGQGATVLQFLREANLEEFKTKVKMCRDITREEDEARWIEAGLNPESNSPFVDMSVFSKHKELYYENSRDTGAKIFDLISKSKNGLLLSLETSFAANSLFCEWAYVVDLDKNVLEIYRGFNNSPLSEGDRFFFLQDIDKIESESKRFKEVCYYPIKIVHSFPLNNLPDDVESFYPPDEKEEE